jgi:hypothetical protein
MTELEQLKSELPRLRALTRAVSLAETESWTAQERVRIGNEVRWCVDALTELGLQLKVVQRPV